MEYLNWRYSDRRGGDYILKEAIEGERALGYVVLRVNGYQEKYPVGYIVDLLALPGRYPDYAPFRENFLRAASPVV